MALNHKQLGSVLLITLIFCMASTVFMLLLFETTILDIKMLNYYVQKKQLHLNYLFHLQSIEKQLAEGMNPAQLKGVTHLQWIPDSLSCHETEGIHYYRITHEQTQPDGASNQFTSIYAIRRSLLVNDIHPNQRYCARQYQVDENGCLWKIEQGQKTIIPLSSMLPIAKVLGKVIVGRSSKEGSVLLYVWAQKKYHMGHVIIILVEEEGQELLIHQIIDTNGILYQPLLRNQILAVNNDECLMLFAAESGEFLRQAALVFTGEKIENPVVLSPTMLVRKPKEEKRLFRVPTSKGWAKGEIDIDSTILGRRTWHEA
ncbi:hypothetical protein [Candidatus Berkiella aquae]|uniref:Uncharacterized protein n=1 Tax=Candidatus Berkiella aquae TaxID=295108 RepID=A0A0Q9YPR4_9GAMM|nr:hypothetical protein [Candidatus Berkiella aquae]MCS5711845.1 hypothetical protein [Candidatus Berkiella aquae]